MNSTTPLSQLTAAEATVVQALNAVAGQLEQIGGASLDEALQRVQAGASAAKDRLVLAAASLADAVADVVGAFAGTAAQIVAALALNDLQPVEPAAQAAPVAEARAVPTGNDPVYPHDAEPVEAGPVAELPAKAPAIPKSAAAYTGRGDAREARQEPQDPESPQEVYTVAIASQKQRQAVEPAREAVVAVAACSPVEPPAGSPARDDRTAARRKPRGKRR